MALTCMCVHHLDEDSYQEHYLTFSMYLINIFISASADIQTRQTSKNTFHKDISKQLYKQVQTTFRKETLTKHQNHLGSTHRV